MVPLLAPLIPPDQPEGLRHDVHHILVEIQRHQVIRATHDSNPIRRPSVADQYQPGYR